MTDLLEELGLKGWPLVRNVTGTCERGQKLGDEVTGVSPNHWILTTWAEQDLERIVEALRPLLTRIGGICLVSDAQWGVH